ncbi:hypothetical protein SAMN05216230_11710 [Pseudomonas soli]|uniref:Uncharacterized protein n=1 Tax=Pseudomonas soli TaxID=1306993 RepID=A0A1H9TY44_9PSED|nr:hypothetical protein SAMN05216230_11710 [Pseudomonas soli]
MSKVFLPPILVGQCFDTPPLQLDKLLRGLAKTRGWQFREEMA